MTNTTPEPWTRLFLDEAMPAAELHALAGGQAAVFTAPRPDREGPNEDAAGLVAAGPDAAVLMVADGVGSTPGGRLAAHGVLWAMTRQVQEACATGTLLRTAILDGLEQANRDLVSGGGGGATTVAVAVIEGDQVRTYHVGDSSVLLLGQRGRLKLQTIDHSPVGFAQEAGVLNEEQALRHEERHLVSNVVGVPEMRIEVGASLRLAPRDTVLLASDGLMDNLRIEEISALLRRGAFPRVMAALLARAHARMQGAQDGRVGKPDDLTVIAFRRYGLPRPRRA